MLCIRGWPVATGHHQLDQNNIWRIFPPKKMLLTIDDLASPHSDPALSDNYVFAGWYCRSLIREQNRWCFWLISFWSYTHVRCPDYHWQGSVEDEVGGFRGSPEIRDEKLFLWRQLDNCRTYFMDRKPKVQILIDLFWSYQGKWECCSKIFASCLYCPGLSVWYGGSERLKYKPSIQK